MSKAGTAIQILALLSERGALPGLTRGEIRQALGLPADIEITARIREVRDLATYGKFDIRVDRSGREYRYYMLKTERARAKSFIASKMKTEKRAA